LGGQLDEFPFWFAIEFTFRFTMTRPNGLHISRAALLDRESNRAENNLQNASDLGRVAASAAWACSPAADAVLPRRMGVQGITASRSLRPAVLWDGPGAMR